MSSTEKLEIRREGRLRRQMHREGFVLRKSRVRNPHVHDLGGYMILDGSSNTVAAGSNFDLDLDDVEQWLRA
jgi:hypothetical protein